MPINTPRVNQSTEREATLTFIIWKDAWMKGTPSRFFLVPNESISKEARAALAVHYRGESDYVNLAFLSENRISEEDRTAYQSWCSCWVGYETRLAAPLRLATREVITHIYVINHDPNEYASHKDEPTTKGISQEDCEGQISTSAQALDHPAPSPYPPGSRYGLIKRSNLKRKA
jgi:hypothetical protein